MRSSRSLLFGQSPLERRRVLRHEPADHQADGERHAEDRPDLTLHLGLHLGQLALLIDEGRAIERLHFVGDADGRLALGHEAAQQRPRLGRPAAAVGRQHFVGRRVGTRESPRADDRRVRAPPPSRGTARTASSSVSIAAYAASMLRRCSACAVTSGIEQRVSEQHRGLEHLRAHGREQLLRLLVARADAGAVALRLAHALRHLIAGKQPQPEHQSEAGEQHGANRQPFDDPSPYVAS